MASGVSGSLQPVEMLQNALVFYPTALATENRQALGYHGWHVVRGGSRCHT
jgi:hypothetical protein